MMSLIIETAVLGAAILQTVQASELCKDAFREALCQDYGMSIGYCCDVQPPFFGEIRCCYYTAWWGIWYVWVVIGIGFGIVAGLVTLACRAAFVKEPKTKVERLDTTNRDLEVRAVQPEADRWKSVSCPDKTHPPPYIPENRVQRLNTPFNDYIHRTGKVNPSFDDNFYPN